MWTFITTETLASHILKFPIIAHNLSSLVPATELFDEIAFETFPATPTLSNAASMQYMPLKPVIKTF